MKQVSDIRLGGTLLSVATLICGGFAIAALVPLMQWNPGQPTSNAPTPDPAQPIVHQEQLRFREFHTATTDSQPQQGPADSASSDGASAGYPPMSQVVPRGSTAGDPAFQQTTSPRGVYVPVNVHPVTVNVDGSALAEQLAVLADGMDKMLAAHREASQSYRLATAPPSVSGTGGSQIGRHEDRLTEIDTSVRELLEKVESLRMESRTADSRLTEEVRQAKLASDLLQEFRLTLAEHRQFLADSPRSFPTSAARIAQHPEPGIDAPSDEREELLVPEPLDLDPEPPLWDALEDIEKPDGLDVPLPPDADQRTSSIVSPPTSVQVVLPVGGQSPFEAAESTLDGDESFATSGPTDGTTDLTEGSEPTSVMFASPHGVIVEPDPGSDHRPLNLSLNPTDDIKSIGKVPADTFSNIPAAAIPGAKPVVFEQTFSFVMPPATNPLPLVNVQTDGLDTVGRTDYAQPANSQESTAPSHAALPVPGRHAPTTASVNRESAPSTTAGDRNGMKRIYPKFASPTHVGAASVNRQPASPRLGMHGGVATVRDPGAGVSGHVYDVTGRRHHRHSSEVTKQTKRSSVLHRLASGIRSVGRTRTVD